MRESSARTASVNAASWVRYCWSVPRQKGNSGFSVALNASFSHCAHTWAPLATSGRIGVRAAVTACWYAACERHGNPAFGHCDGVP